MTPPLESILVVVCYGISDIGKGWLTAAIAGLSPDHTLPLKIDPLLNLSFPQHLGLPIRTLCEETEVAAFMQIGRADSGDFRVSEDLGTYRAAGVKVYPECNIVAGDLINRFLNSPDVYVRPGEIKKRTFNDLSRFLAEEITSIVRARTPIRLIIEIGGTVEDSESIYIPGAIRFLAQPDLLGVTPEVILLTYFDYAESSEEGRYRVKTQHIRRGILQTSRAYYHLPLKACFARRRHIPEAISDDVLRRDLCNVAYETQIASERIILLPNISQGDVRENVKGITDLVRRTGLFGLDGMCSL